MKSGSYLRYAIALLVVLATIVIVCTWLKSAEEQIPIITPVGESGKIWEEPGTNAVPAQTDYQLIIGANPQFNKKQVFLPPTDSVVITNEAQLRELIKKEKQARQNTNNPR